MKTIDKYILLTMSLGVVPNIISAQGEKENSLPNVIYIMADDLGIGDLGCYGQRIIQTPGIDNLAATGMRFAQHYTGCTVSAPSRCCLMTGKHTGHSFIRGNKGVKASDGYSYDYPLADDEITVAEILKKRNYATACIGKWGLGGPKSEGYPTKQGFDYFFGYLGQGNAHRYYPAFLFENEKKIMLNGEKYSHDLIIEKALSFIEKKSDKPFFLYLAPTLPHPDLVVPSGELGEYDGMFDEKPYLGKDYTPQSKPRATYAAMVSRLDRDVQRVVDLVEKKGLSNNTIIIFTSDNGVHKEGGHDPEVFDSNSAFRGYKRDLYEGGIRTPFIIRWPAKVKKGSVSYHISAFWDFLPTMCDLIGEQVPVTVDGISFLPELTGQGELLKHDYLYWEFHEQGGKQAILLNDNWKLIKLQVNNPQKTKLELYNLNSDPSEQMNVSKQYPEKVRILNDLLQKAHKTSVIFPFAHEKKE
ncbi:arylsulfatase [Phocaeicola sartorii]|uniref:Sulfatase N-terminal domain-containing protein n=1 Tax=Phocaeicola sartorii TaxID=671267 RepID=R9I1H0_9BACT|nr:arylsulfatase [Phocaeicola sartorii]EOS09941.1 hypothetical protein C802_03494 [Phocaeicola sartorii]MCR1845956.1 arylsulfatase [Phocaeicola sartorii]NUK98191.1 arylsulfatase [Phocaeicola sartorii]